MSLKTGQYIRHFKYGCGTIVERDDDRTTVDFDTFGVRKFVTALAAFEVEQGEAPKKKRVVAKRRVKTPVEGAQALPS